MQEDFYNVEDFNANADIIDRQLKTLSDGLGSAAQESTLSALSGKVGETGNTGGSTTAGTVFGKLNKLIADIASHMASYTAARAGYIDTIKNNTTANNTASKTGTLSQKEAFIINLLENTTYGLNALRTKLDTPGVIKSVQKGTITGEVEDTTRVSVTISSVNPNKSFVILNNGSYCSGDTPASSEYLISLSSTVLTVKPASSYRKVLMSWQVVEFY